MNIRGENINTDRWIVQQRNYPDGRIKDVIFRPLQRVQDQHLSEYQLYSAFADFMKSQIASRIQRNLGVRWNNERIFRHVHGLLSMSSIGVDRKAKVESLYLSEISYATVLELLLRVRQSNLQVPIYSLEFTFWINPASLQLGGSPLKTKYKGCHQKIPYGIRCNGNIVNCAALALEYMIWYQGLENVDDIRNLTRVKDFWSRLANKAYERQIELGWGDYVSVSEVSKYLIFAPDFKIVVIYPALNRQSDREWEGLQYQSNGLKKILYLVYDHTNFHFVIIIF